MRATAPLLNEGLALAMAWGQDWLMPIQTRLRQRHPALSEQELDEINAFCQTAMKFGHAEALNQAPDQPDDAKKAAFSIAVKARYPWINDENLSQLYSQGMYYAMK